LSNQITNGVTVGNYVLALGSVSDQPIAGDWTAQAHSRPGVYRPVNGSIYLKDTLVSGYADTNFVFGASSDIAVAGHWVAGIGVLSNQGQVIVATQPAPPPQSTFPAAPEPVSADG
jgi:hypothetical protein